MPSNLERALPHRPSPVVRSQRHHVTGFAGSGLGASVAPGCAGMGGALLALERFAPALTVLPQIGNDGAQLSDQGIRHCVALRCRGCGHRQRRENPMQLRRVDLPAAGLVALRRPPPGLDRTQHGRAVDAARGGGGCEVVPELRRMGVWPNFFRRWNGGARRRTFSSLGDDDAGGLFTPLSRDGNWNERVHMHAFE
jgi:hypothetical protein